MPKIKGKFANGASALSQEQIEAAKKAADERRAAEFAMNQKQKQQDNASIMAMNGSEAASAQAPPAPVVTQITQEQETVSAPEESAPAVQEADPFGLVPDETPAPAVQAQADPFGLVPDEAAAPVLQAAEDESRMQTETQSSKPVAAEEKKTPDKKVFTQPTETESDAPTMDLFDDVQFFETEVTDAAQTIAAEAPQKKAGNKLNRSIFRADEPMEPSEDSAFPTMGILEKTIDLYDPDELELDVAESLCYCQLARSNRPEKNEAWMNACKAMHEKSAASLKTVLLDWILADPDTFNAPRFLAAQGTKALNISDVVQDTAVQANLNKVGNQLWETILRNAEGTESPKWIYGEWITELLQYAVDYFMIDMK